MRFLNLMPLSKRTSFFAPHRTKFTIREQGSKKSTIALFVALNCILVYSKNINSGQGIAINKFTLSAKPDAALFRYFNALFLLFPYI